MRSNDRIPRAKKSARIKATNTLYVPVPICNVATGVNSLSEQV
jgi:hypothetical protein